MAGEVLRNDCTGLVMMKTFLTGMPECKFGLNDKLIMDKEAQNPAKADGDKKRSVEVRSRPERIRHPQKHAVIRM